MSGCAPYRCGTTQGVDEAVGAVVEGYGSRRETHVEMEPHRMAVEVHGSIGGEQVNCGADDEAGSLAESETKY